MTGERDLRKLLRHMTPQLQPGTFVFCTFPDNDLPADVAPIATFREAEGLSAVLALDEAQRAGVPYQFESGLTTLTIHSSLDAVGFLAAVFAVLAEAGIPCNAVAALHHDHLWMAVRKRGFPAVRARFCSPEGFPLWITARGAAIVEIRRRGAL